MKSERAPGPAKGHGAFPIVISFHFANRDRDGKPLSKASSVRSSSGRNGRVAGQRWHPRALSLFTSTAAFPLIDDVSFSLYASSVKLP